MRYNLFAGVVFAAAMFLIPLMALNEGIWEQAGATPDRKSTRLNSSHQF